MITNLRSESDSRYSLSELTQLFGVSPSGYRHHQSDPMTESRKRKIELLAEVKAIHHDPKLQVYGSPRMTKELNARGFEVTENTVAKLMAEHSIVAKGARTFRPPKTTTPDPDAKYSPNLIKGMEPSRFGEVLVSDITYIPTKEGWLYLAVVIDLYSRAVLGWQISNRMPASLVTRSIKEAIRAWRFDPHQTIFHSDRGSQYTSRELRELLDAHGITQSMSAKGNCYDNATCESFFASLKRELLPEIRYFDSRFQAHAAIFEHLEGFYNTRRRHSSLGMLSPTQFLDQNQKTALAA